MATLEELKSKLQGLKTRADNLASKKESLVRESTVQGERMKTAVVELKDLGYEVEDLTPTQLAALSDKIQEELTTRLSDLETSVVATEQLLGITSSADLD